MPNTCTICRHPAVTEINNELLLNRSFRHIASQLGINYRSLGRHASTCVAEQLEAAREGNMMENALTVERVVSDMWLSLKRLIDLADEHLRDPNNPSKYTLAPRIEDVSVIWLDPQEKDSNGNPVKHRTDLQELLAQVSKTKTKVKIVEARVPKVNYVKLLLEAARESGPFLDKLAKLRGDYKKAERNPKDLRWVEDMISRAINVLECTREEAIKWYQEKFPNVREFKGIH